MTTTLHLHRDAGSRRWSRPWNRAADVVDARQSPKRSPETPDAEPNEDRDAEAKPPLWRRTLSVLFTALIIAAAIYVWPARLGGETRLVIVSGHSMEPTYDLGDIVVARGGGTPEVDDAVVFAVPEGTAEGMLVIHRILERDSDGRFITQGDNRDTPDQWPLTEADIVGEPLLHIPKGGVVVRFFQQLWVLAIVLGLLAMFLLWPDASNDDDEVDEEEQDASAKEPDLDTSSARAEIVAVEPGLADVTLPLRRPDLVTTVDELEVLAVGRWSSTQIDATAMAEAEAWLDEQLAAALDDRTPVTA